MLNNLSTNFFLASSTTDGFYSIFDQLYQPKNGWFCYILKGGPGTGKSSLMKKVSLAANKKGIFSECIHCSSDPHSLDAVILPSLKICIVDGTAPHVLDPIYPGCSDIIINLGEYWNTKKLQKNKSEMFKLFSENADLHLNAKELLCKSREVFISKNKILSKFVNTEKLKSFCESISNSILKKVSKNNIFKGEKLRFITAITPKGYMSFDETFKTLADTIYIIEDDFDVISTYILNYIRSEVLKSNITAISCISPILPQNSLDAIILPELKLAFLRKNNKLFPDLFNGIPEYKKINASRFLNLKAMNQNKNILNLYNKLSVSLVEAAVKNLSQALEVHDEIENYYKASMNYSKIDKTTEKIINNIFG